MTQQLRILALAPYCDGTDVGEAWCAYQWISHLSERADVTLLTLKRDGWRPPSEQLPNVEVIEWDELRPWSGLKRLNSMLKPGYLRYWLSTRRWIREALRDGRQFDVAHQFTPFAIRYPSPLATLPIPYVLGPLCGSLPTPPGFEEECRGSASWFTRLRAIDRFRLRYDGLLKQTYARAAVVLGVAPYVEDLLEHASPERFEIVSELGIESLAAEREDRLAGQPLQLLHVGRGVRTKGLRDAVRAIAQLPDDLAFHLHSAGEGEEIELCRQEAERLGVTEKVTFHGQIPRNAVEKLYQQADIFLFPSFREPSGSVIFEALRNGLPIITANVGGPGFVIDASCGLKIDVQTPEQFARDLAAAITCLGLNPQKLSELSEGARQRIASIGLWRNKLDWLTRVYKEVVEARLADTSYQRRKEIVQHV